jgi:hypothetical protein
MKSQVNIEWLVEELVDGSEDADIQDVCHFNSYAEAKAWAAQEDFARIGLVRDRGNDTDGLICRSWAYIEDGNLPTHFENANGAEIAKVPAKYHRELTA